MLTALGTALTTAIAVGLAATMTPLLLSLSGGIVNLGMGAGVVLGGTLTDTTGPTWLPVAAAALALAACPPIAIVRAQPPEADDTAPGTTRSR
ncbi:hypothetical protein [Amycolatopsis magusensis]|uniref:hypothetical protein n=1 Tax=Amycolatopsis magusensis TaxID=882444 RepID=UPI0037AF3B62